MIVLRRLTLVPPPRGPWRPCPGLPNPCRVRGGPQRRSRGAYGPAFACASGSWGEQGADVERGRGSEAFEGGADPGAAQSPSEPP